MAKTKTNEAVRGDSELRYANEFTVTAREQVVAHVPWRAAIDVWAWGYGVTGTQLIGTLWKLYAVSGQVRVLVAKNACQAGSAVVISASTDMLILGARNIVCDRFEVTVQQAPLTLAAVPPIATVPCKISVSGYGVEVNGPPRGFPNPPLLSGKTRPPGASIFGGEFGGGATRFMTKGVIDVSGLSQAPALLVEATGFSTAASTRFIHIFGVFPTPPDGDATAQYIIQVPAGGSFSYAPSGGEFYPQDFGDNTLYNAAGTAGPGISYAVSTTAFVLTRELVGTCAIDVAFYGVP